MSLVESCLSVAILSTAATIAVPSLMRARESYELDAAARQVAGKIQLTRIKAVAGNRDCRIRPNSGVSFVIECEDVAWRLEESFVLPRGLHMTATASPEFHKHGNASPAGTIVIWNDGGRSRRVIVNIAGRVRVDP
jgi:Tfp pilus assembly protein FimT